MRIKKICILIILFILLIYLSLDLKENYTAGYEDYLSQGSGSYSWGSEKVFHKNNDGETVPLDYPHDLKDVSKEVKKII